jgi:hypothetical protein
MAGTKVAVEGSIPLIATSLLGASPTSLDGIIPFSLADGALCYVRAPDAVYRFFDASLAAHNPPSVIRPAALTAGEAGRWLLTEGGNVAPSASVEQSAWFVNSTTGNDSNDGATPATALLTLAELTRRIGGGTLTLSTTITLTGDFSAQVFALDVTIDANVLVTVVGDLVIADSGSITAVMAAAPATNTRGQITDATQSFTDKSRLKLTSGAIVGSIAYVTRVIAATNVNVSAWALLSNPLTSQLPTIGTPSIGNTYDVETLSTTIGRVQVQVHGSGRLVFKDLVITPATSGAHRATNDSSQLANVMFWGCRFGSAQSCLFYDSIACFISCAWDGTMVLAKSVATMRATTNRGVLKADLSSEVQFARSCNFDGGTLWVSGHSEATITGSPGDVEFSDVVADAAVTVDPGSVVDANQQLTTIVWGANNTLSWAFLIRSGGFYTYAVTTAPVLSGGGTADISLGGNNTAYGVLPAINASNNAAMVERL